MKYYLITYDKERYNFMEQQFLKHNIDIKDVEVMNYPNREDLTEDMIRLSYSSDRFKDSNNPIYTSAYSLEWHNPMPLGLISCSYKHYLCIKNIYDLNLPYGIIMEDNILITKNVKDTVNDYLLEAGEDWDIIFDGDLCNLHAPDIVNGKLLYSVNQTRGLNFYIVSKQGSKKLIDTLLPFSLNLDNFINLLMSEKAVDLNVFWAESGMVKKIYRPSTWR